MDGLGLQPGAFRQPLRRPASRGGQQRLDALGPEDRQDGADDGGLADARSAREDEQLGGQRPAHGLLLGWGERHIEPPLHPVDRLLGIDRGPWWMTDAQAANSRCNGVLGAAQVGQEHAWTPIDGIDHHTPFGNL